MKKFTTILFIVLFSLFCVLYYFTFSFKINIDKTFKVENGATLSMISNDLREEKMISNPILFKLYYKIFVKDTLKAGNHIFLGSYTIPEVASVITTPIQAEVREVQRLTIPEGWTKYKIAKYLSENTNFEYDNILKYLDSGYKNGVLYDKYSFLQDERIVSLEGFLYPDTYEIYKDTNLESILAKILDNFETKVIKKYSLNDNIYDILKIASIIEKEAKHDEDRKYVASVIYNRINNNMRLEMDSTVVYFSQNATNVANDRKIQNDYNTYLNVGLPVGPIANPGDKSIDAAIHPASSNYFYFVTDSNGKAVFAKTYEEHEKNIRKYLY